jgi:hypothetical protein
MFDSAAVRSLSSVDRYNGLPIFDMNEKQIQAWLLRLAGTFELLAFFAVIMPRSWMEVAHVWLGLGEMPGGPILMFMIRQASYTYGMHGLSLWVLSLNVERFRPLIILNGISFLLAGPVFFLIDYTTGMPLWWALGDTFGCGLLGVVLLWLSRRR